MQTMKASLFMDKLGYTFLNTILIAAMPVALISTIVQAF